MRYVVARQALMTFVAGRVGFVQWGRHDAAPVRSERTSGVSARRSSQARGTRMRTYRRSADEKAPEGRKVQRRYRVFAVVAFAGCLYTSCLPLSCDCGGTIVKG